MSQRTIEQLANEVLTMAEPWWGNEADRKGIDRNLWFRPNGITWDEASTFLDVPLTVVPVNDPYLKDDFVRITREDRLDVTFDVARKGYTVHRPRKWLLDVAQPLMETALKKGLKLASVLCLKDGAMTTLTFELDEVIRSEAGLAIRPYLGLLTSHDKSLATQTRNGVIVPVCDNTAIAFSGSGQGVTDKIKHTSGSDMRWGKYATDVATFLGVAEQVKVTIDMLASIPVTDNQFDKMLESYFVPGTDSDKSKTMARNAQDTTRTIYRNDVRAAPWKGTVLGAYQAFNTYGEHYQTVRNMDRAYRSTINRAMVVTDDARIFTVIGTVLDNDAVKALAA